MELSNFNEAFQSPDYLKFKELVTKSSADGSVKVSNGSILYGKLKAKVPAFIDADALQNKLEYQRVSLLKTYSDLQDKIIIAENPILYKKQYDCTVDAIEKIELTLDKLKSFIEAMYQEHIMVPLTELQSGLDKAREKANMIITSAQGNVHLSKKQAIELADIHKRVMSLQGQITQANGKPIVNYVIWEETSDNQCIDSTHKVTSSGPKEIKSRKSSKSVKLTPAKKAIIKESAKKLMVEKLG